MDHSISKTLSANDIGSTGTHQAGILVPKIQEIISFFPELDHKKKNPRVFLNFYDDADNLWEFCFIYYNNKFFGGTRNEFRLTRMTTFLKQKNLKQSDELILIKNKENYKVTFKRSGSETFRHKKLTLSGQWKVISI